MAGKHLIYIHGRDTKPTREEKFRLIRKALIAGVRRGDPIAADELARGRIKMSLAYYGDLTNQLMVAAEPHLRERMVQIGDVWYDPPDIYDEAIARLLARPTERFTREEYDQLAEQHRNRKFYDELARIASPVISLFGLAKRVTASMFPDLHAYMTSKVIASQIRDRLEGVLKRALVSGDDIALVSHSMGCIVAYDVLWQLSRLSQYRELSENAVSLWLTLGNPLGDTAVRENLIDADEPQEDRYPTNVNAWVNVSARDDFVAHDRDVKDDFREMLERKLVGTIWDITGICNFYVGRWGSNPHKSYGYLNHPTVGRLIAAWMWTP